MKIKWYQVILLLLFIITSVKLEAQKLDNVIWKSGNRYFEDAKSGSVAFPLERNSQIFFLNKSLKVIKDKYLKEQTQTLVHPKFIIPVKNIEVLNDNGYYSISAYVDHNDLYPDQLMDYNCGTHTYDVEDGYNHSGTDFFLWPFPWHKMYSNEVEVVAAAPGILIYKQDGNYDQQCQTNQDAWNGAGILHEDGSTSWYIHLRKNSLSQKNVGETVDSGEYLGVVGSSGMSFSPHLHFEVYNSSDVIIDPFWGSCNPDIIDSWWETQQSYLESGINKICTNDKLPVFGNCPEEEIINENDTFYPGDTIWLMSYFRNIFTGDQVEVRITRPDNSIHSNWIWTSPWQYYNASWLYFFTILNQNDIKGSWNYSMIYKGENYSYSFNLHDPQGVNPVSTFPFSFYPNPALNQLTIENPQSSPIVVRIYSICGVEQLHLNFNQPESKINIALDNLQNGIYFIQLEKEGKIYSSKFVKQ